MIRPDYRCKECKGGGYIYCKCCGHRMACLSCGRSELSGDVVDIKRYQEACGRLFAHFVLSSWYAVDGDGNAIGRHFGKVIGEPLETLYFRDFLKGGAK